MPNIDLKAAGFTYIVIESAWHVALFTMCYRMRPLARIAQGSGYLSAKLGPRLKRELPNTKVHKAAARAVELMNDPWKRATAEWFVLNKFIGIPLWPVKVALAGTIAKNISGSNEAFEDSDINDAR